MVFSILVAFPVLKCMDLIMALFLVNLIPKSVSPLTILMLKRLSRVKSKAVKKQKMDILSFVIDSMAPGQVRRNSQKETPPRNVISSFIYH